MEQRYVKGRVTSRSEFAFIIRVDDWWCVRCQFPYDASDHLGLFLAPSDSCVGWLRRRVIALGATVAL
jgi:hypothetical protein